MDNIKFIDLFAGIGGFHIAAKKSDFNLECVLACEIDKKAQKVYKTNFPDVKMHDDITTLDLDEIPSFDMLFAGFPCQPFSVGGYRKGFSDENRGNLFFEIVRILENKRPKFFILENVKGILTNDSGNTIKVINETLENLGYITTSENLLINSRHIGVPQNRERVFFLGIAKEHYKTNNNIPVPSLPNTKYSWPLSDDHEDNFNISADLNSVIDAWGEFIKNVKRPAGRTLPVIWVDQMINKLPADFDNYPSWKQKYIRDMKLIYKENKVWIDKWHKRHKVNEWCIRDKKLEWQAGADNFDINDTLLQLRQSGLRFSKTNFFPALVAMVQIPIIVNERRYMTPKEVARLQNFPSNYLFDPNPQTTYKQLGNGVTIDVVKVLINHLLEEGVCPD